LPGGIVPLGSIEGFSSPSTSPSSRLSLAHARIQQTLA
jgi:hypothetical protein